MNEIKKCGYRSNRTKTQTPIVAKLTYVKVGVYTLYHHKWNLHFVKFIDDKSMRKKSITIPINKDSTPVFHVYLVSLASLLYRYLKRKSIEK